jgi:tetratricopeptide (TPR) repeat protein
MQQSTARAAAPEASAAHRRQPDPSSVQRVARAVADVESTLERSSRRYPANLPHNHGVRQTGWKPELKRSGECLLRYVPDEFHRLSPLARHLEAGRAHAEAVLVRERLDEVILSSHERESLTQRALGIIPGTEEGRFREIIDCPHLRPRRIARSGLELVAAADEVEREFGTATALAYGLLCAAGLRQEPEFVQYGQKLDQVFDRLTSSPAMLQALEWRQLDNRDRGFDLLLGLLIEARRILWHLKPGRVSDEFLLTQALDAYTGDRPGAGNSLGLAAFDSIILSKLGFAVSYLVENDILRLEVQVAGRNVYWEVTEPLPVSFVPVRQSRKLARADLFALVYASLGTYCFAQNRCDKAIEVFRRALELKPDSPETHISIAACHLRKQQPSDAVKALNRALALAPDSAEAYCHQGNAYVMMQHWPEAISAFKRALSIRPDYVEASNNLGLAYMNTGDPAHAEGAFQAAISARPEYYQAYFNLGNLYLEQNQHDKAIAMYRETCRLEPGFAAARYNMGRAYYEKHDLDGSISCYQKAVQLNPRHFGAWHNLGIAYRDKGLIGKAVDALEKAVTLNPCLMR